MDSVSGYTYGYQVRRMLTQTLRPDLDVQFPSKEFRFQMHRFGILEPDLPNPSDHLAHCLMLSLFDLERDKGNYSFFKTEPVPYKLQLQMFKDISNFAKDALANAIAKNDSSTIQICVVLTIKGVNHVVKEEEEEEEEEEECAICLKKFENIDNEATSLNCPCQFLYHHECIWRWLRELRNYSCPVCRKNFAHGTEHFARSPCRRRKLRNE
ncbi:hypothetical protein CICLE_v10013353mg [Citrus x clementina]|uniref:RING-type domain-containing protein n=2 Tax=Citrus TaxID=2706 RepID=V4S706_CITCL|nr:hypothetical protein CICLE_v10013353mg [Citrus x clementina]